MSACLQMNGVYLSVSIESDLSSRNKPSPIDHNNSAPMLSGWSSQPFSAPFLSSPRASSTLGAAPVARHHHTRTPLADQVTPAPKAPCLGLGSSSVDPVLGYYGLSGRA